ncbi:zinc-ribbon domain-containing protein [Altericroceibacterium xinjiangense]|uniref:zinc-ribbon domain-containing protein n=1 Tax=Altericroceibacterium xinjiangense TaxID=762261 RepID=UPI000F7E88AB|nr:zinc-ribbon domain-containing protein [Altericroceibacterium xinjiangense]
MIIACPDCNTRYAVADSAIRPEGRTVRCAKCGHSWFQEGPQAALDDAPVSEAAAEPAPTEEPAVPPVDPGPVAELRSEHETAARAADISEDDAAGSRFDPKPLFASRRAPLRFWAWVVGIVLLIAAATVAAGYYLGLPGWAPAGANTFAQDQPGLRLDFPAARQERHRLPNGTEFFNASGTITNTGSTTRRVPPILIVLRDAEERIVYRWDVISPKRSLAPGETIAVNEAMADIPLSATVAEIGWKPD